MILLGSVQRVELIRLLELHLGRETRQTLSQSGETAAEVVNEKINKKTNGKIGFILKNINMVLISWTMLRILPT